MMSQGPVMATDARAEEIEELATCPAVFMAVADEAWVALLAKQAVR